MEPLIFKTQTPLDPMRLRIEGERVLLLPIADTYAQDMFREFTPEITRYMSPKPAERIEETLAYVSSAVSVMRAGADLVFVIAKKESGEFLGVSGLHGKEKPRTPEFGIWLKKAAHGNRYGREAITTPFDWAVENLDFDYALYPVDRANVASRKIPESLGGMVIEEKKVKSMSGAWLDEVIYRIPTRARS